MLSHCTTSSLSTMLYIVLYLLFTVKKYLWIQFVYFLYAKYYVFMNKHSCRNLENTVSLFYLLDVTMQLLH
jgi:hypothetical protein